MEGMMMHRPLLVSNILEYGMNAHRKAGITSVRTEGDIHSYTYPEAGARIAQLAHGLRRRGVQIGDRVATLAWNGYRHFELYYAVGGIGAICHTINPRLSAEQLIYIVNHAEDKLLFLDTTFVPVIAAVAEHLPDDLTFVIMTDRAHMPDTPFDALCYEELLEGEEEAIAWPELDENTACGLCYTSGTTGHPKGALYSNRSSVLHALTLVVSQKRSFEEGKPILPVVPLFHVNAWGLPYVAPMIGASLVMPGPALDGPSLFKLMDQEKVYSAWGVPTVWMGLLGEIEAQGRIPRRLRRRGHRRLRRAALYDRGLRDARREGRPCLGHDRNVAHRHPRLPARLDGGTALRGAHRRQDQAGPALLRRRPEDRRRGRQGPAPGRRGRG